MYGFLQLIADGSPNKHQRKKKSKGRNRNRREYKRTPLKKKNASRTFGSQLWYEKGISQIDQFLTTLHMKRMQFEVHKGSPPRVAKFQAIIVLTNVWCSSIFFVWVSAADSWWQPKQASKKKRKAKVGTEENTSEHPLKKEKTIPQELLDQNCEKKMGFPNWPAFDSTLHFKRMQFEVHKGAPPRVAKFKYSIKAIIVLTNARCSSIFYVWVSVADNWWQPQPKKENVSGHLQKNNTTITFGLGLCTHWGLTNWAVSILV